MIKNASNEIIVDKFDVVILGDYEENEQLFAKAFPFKHKFINRFDLVLRDKIKFPKDFMNFEYPEIIDKIINLDILIITYSLSNKLSIDYLKKFYYLYYNKFEEKDKPKKIIMIEFGCNSISKNEDYENTETSPLDEIQKLYNGYHYYHKDSEEKLLEIFQKCVLDLKLIYGFCENYRYYDDIKIVENNKVDIFILLYGNKEIENTFLQMLLESKCNFQHNKFLDNFHELKYSKTINNNNYNFIIRLNMMDKENCFNSIASILLYDINNEESFNETRSIVKEYITTNGPRCQQIFNIISINTTPNIISEFENNEEIQRGKYLSYEMGATFSVLNTNSKNIGDEIKVKIDNILDKILENINHTKNEKYLGEIEKKQTSEKIDYNDFEFLKKIDSPSIYINELNNNISNKFKNNHDFLFNICPTCYEHLNIHINDISNIITIYCDQCKGEPKGLDSEQFNKYKKSNSKLVRCQHCQNILNYDFATKKLFCECKVDSKKHRKSKSGKRNCVTNFVIPCFLKDSYCVVHKKFNKYYAKYSKKGFCEDCKGERENKYFINIFKENIINDLIKQKKAELNKELEFITSLQNKFNECINSLLSKFEKLIEKKIKMHVIKSDLINNLEIIKNNCTIISNVTSLKFDIGDKFSYNESDSTENKIKNIYDYLNCHLDVDNLYFVKKNDIKKASHMGPFNNLIIKEKDIKITDICGLNKNKYVCVSFNDGQAKIFDSKMYEKNSYPKCIIKEFLPKQGINSMYVSDKNNIWKIKSTNNNELIYLNGFEELKIIQMNKNYDSYNRLYTIKDECCQIYSSMDYNYNNIMLFDSYNMIKTINFNNKENNEVITDLNDVTDFLIPDDKFPVDIRKVNDNIISFTLVNFNGIMPRITENKNEMTLMDEQDLGRPTLKWNDFYSMKDVEYINDYKLEESTRETISKINENDKEFYLKIIYLDNCEEFNEENTTKDEFNVKIKKEFMFEKNYSLLGCISNEDNLLLLNYLDDNSNHKLDNILYIFDFNICQFVNAFRYHSESIQPLLFAELNNNYLYDKKEFIICDKDLSAIQYCYEKGYSKKIYYINSSIAEDNNSNDKRAIKVLCLDNLIIILCNNSEYYILTK